MVPIVFLLSSELNIFVLILPFKQFHYIYSYFWKGFQKILTKSFWAFIPINFLSISGGNVHDPFKPSFMVFVVGMNNNSPFSRNIRALSVVLVKIKSICSIRNKPFRFTTIDLFQPMNESRISNWCCNHKSYNKPGTTGRFYQEKLLKLSKLR